MGKITILRLNTIGDRVRYIRVAILKMNQKELAEILGYSTHQAVLKLEKNNNDLSIESAKRICKKANVNYEWLIEGSGEILKDTSPHEYNDDSIDKINSIFNHIDEKGLDLVNPHNVRQSKLLEELRAAIYEALELKKQSNSVMKYQPQDNHKSSSDGKI